MRTWLYLSFLFCLALNLPALKAGTGVEVLENIPYRSGAGLSDDEKAHCQLDLYLPAGGKSFPTLVWFHGGGLETGDKKDTAALARSFAQIGIGVVSANYRLSPKARYPSYVEDAAAAVAWTHAHIVEHGGDQDQLYVGGHSAGGWLALMVGLDGH